MKSVSKDNIPTFSFATAAFVSDKYHDCASRLIEVVRSNLTSNISCLTNSNLSKEINKRYLKILKKYKTDLTKSYIWKPWYVLSCLNRLPPDGVLFYLDGGSEISENFNSIIELKRLIKKTYESGSTYFSNNYDSLKIADEDAINLLSKIFKKKIKSHDSIAAGALILRNDHKTNSIIRKWCYISLVNSGFAFIGTNTIKHRHDQIILSALLDFHKIKILKYPIWFDDMMYFYKSIYCYPIHTNRNKTNISFLNSFKLLKNLIFLRLLYLNDNYKFFLKILYFIKRKINKFFILNQISPELFNYKKKFFEKNFEMQKTIGDFKYEVSHRKLITGLKLNDVSILSDGCVVYKNNFMISHQRLFGKRSNKLFKLRLLMLKKISPNIEKGVMCLNENSDNLYHFIYDCLINSFSYFHKDKTIILGPGLVDFKKEFFSSLKLKVQFIKKSEILKVKQLDLYDLPDYSGQPNKNSINDFKNYIDKNFKLEDSNFKKNYIIQRSKKNGRNLILSNNQKKILNEDFLFNTIDLANMPLLDQMKVFANAKKIIANHGASLSWMILCNQQIKIIELRSLINQNCIYEKISKILNLNYSFFNESIGEKNRYNKLNVSNPDIYINDFLFLKIIDSLK